MRRLLSLSLVALAIAASPRDARGHAEEPIALAAFSLPNGEFLVRANFGVVSSTEPDRHVCEEAYFGGAGWFLGVLGPTEWVTFGEISVERTTDGCNFDRVKELPRRPAHATADAASGVAVYLMNGLESPGVWLSTDRGASFSPVAGFDTESEQLTRSLVLDGETLLVSSYAREDGAALLRRVDLDTRAVTDVPLPDGLTYPNLLDARGGQIALLARREAYTLIWGSVDDLLAADEREIPNWPAGALLSSDGNEVWIGGVENGVGILHGVREGGDVAWTTLAAEDTASCLGGDEASLFVCGLSRIDGADVFAVDGNDVAPVLDFRDMKGPRLCPPSSDVGEVCPVVWREMAPYFGADPDADIGVFIPEADAGVEPEIDVSQPPGDTPEPRTGCCATSGPTERHSAMLLVIAILIGVGHRRRTGTAEKTSPRRTADGSG